MAQAKAKGGAKFELQIAALDQFTKPFEGFAKRVEEATAGVRVFGRDISRMQHRLSANLGFPQIQKSLGRVQRMTANVGREFDAFTGRIRGLASTLGIFGLAGGGAAAGLFGLVKGFADAGDEAERMAQKLGLTTQQWQEMSYAARLNGVESSELMDAYKELNLRMFDAAKGGKTQQEAFKALGVSIRNNDGKLKAADRLMLDVADAFSQMADGAEKAALSEALMGEAGFKMLPLLSMSREELAKIRREAVDRVLVFDDEDINAGKNFINIV